jgi:hypothetical protein
MEPKERRPAHFSQWAAQFAVASELCKHLFQVAMTLGNHPTADLMVISPKGRPFIIDVKGLYKGGTWLVQREMVINPNLYYVLAFVPPHASNEFFVMSQETTNRLIRGDTSASDIRRADLMEHLNKWTVLPDWPVEPPNKIKRGQPKNQKGPLTK